jgi:hypothetical protein
MNAPSKSKAKTSRRAPASSFFGYVAIDATSEQNGTLRDVADNPLWAKTLVLRRA